MKRPVLTMIPGPTPVHPRILDALAEPTISHVAPRFVECQRECLARLREVVMTTVGSPFVVAGSGTLAMEMALVNLLPPGGRLLVVSHGYFGDRWVELAAAFGVECEHLRAEWGSHVPPEELQRRLVAGPVDAVAVTHVDTSTGTAAPLADYAEILRGHEALWILDGVCATAGMEERFDDWGIDMLVTGAQKALGAPPGVAIAVASPRAMEARRSRERISAYSADLLRWQPIMEDPSRYFSTPAVNEVFALREALRLVLEEGLEPRFVRHARIAAAVRAGLATLGLEPFTGAACRADTLSVVSYPEGVDDARFRASMAERGVVVAAALGPIAGRAFRMGHMGNIGADEVYRTLDAVEESLVDQGRDARGATEAARRILSSV
jgi:aspartate aminotransferase-like enzyme